MPIGPGEQDVRKLQLQADPYTMSLKPWILSNNLNLEMESVLIGDQRETFSHP